ncbi:MAG: hypothetical protein RIQ60_251 [Pseudomonadota bacterium]|jgi:hypothetical protein
MTPDLPPVSTPRRRALLSPGALMLAGAAMVAVAAAAAPPATQGSVAGTAATAHPAAGDEDLSPLRRECNVGRRHVEVRNCMVERSRASTQEVDEAEAALRDLLSERAAVQPAFKRTAANYEAASKSYARYRHYQCEYAVSLVTGQAVQRETRLSCTYDFNLKRKQHLAELRAALPEALPASGAAAGVADPGTAPAAAGAGAQRAAATGRRPAAMANTGAASASRR